MLSHPKLQQLADIEGVDPIALLEQGVEDSVCLGICVNDGCDQVADVEPDCRDGWCDSCGTHTVKSALVLADLI